MALHRGLVLHHLRGLWRRAYLDADLPSCGRAYLLKQAEAKRYVAHLLYAPPLPRATAMPLKHIEDLPPLHNVAVRLDVDEEVTAARLVPGDQEGPFSREDGVITLALPPFSMHQGVVFDYAAPPYGYRLLIGDDSSRSL